MTFAWVLTGCILAAGPWNLPELQQAPAVHEAGLQAEGVRGIFYEALPWKGKPTRAFAWLGIPPHAAGERLPAVVLAHGGGGTAYDEWVRLWNARGYVAIAPDLEGTLPVGEFPDRQKHEWSGPMRTGGFEDLEDPPQDQWYYHAVADIILANSLLRTRPEVDPERVGLTGISWGGILSCTVAGVDNRFAFVIPVYGCGFLNEAPVFQKRWEQLGPEKTQRWHELWDGASYLGNASMPMLWVNGTNDQHFPLDIHSKSYALPRGPKTLSVRVGMRHSHPDGWQPEEIYAFADSVVKAGEALPTISEAREEEGVASATFVAGAGAKVELVYTEEVSDRVKAAWKVTQVVPVEKSDGTYQAVTALPAASKAWFFNLENARGLVVSSPVQMRH